VESLRQSEPCHEPDQTVPESLLERCAGNVLLLLIQDRVGVCI
jgi:hypothetical protein